MTAIVIVGDVLSPRDLSGSGTGATPIRRTFFKLSDVKFRRQGGRVTVGGTLSLARVGAGALNQAFNLSGTVGFQPDEEIGRSLVAAIAGFGQRSPPPGIGAIVAAGDHF